MFARVKYISCDNIPVYILYAVPRKYARVDRFRDTPFSSQSQRHVYKGYIWQRTEQDRHNRKQDTEAYA